MAYDDFVLLPHYFYPFWSTFLIIKYRLTVQVFLALKFLNFLSVIPHLPEYMMTLHIK